MYRALISFSGLISMAEGEVREIADKAIEKDLLNAGYIERVSSSEPEKKPKEKPEEKAEEKAEEKPKRKTTKKKKKVMEE